MKLSIHPKHNANSYLDIIGIMQYVFSFFPANENSEKAVGAEAKYVIKVVSLMLDTHYRVISLI